MKKISTRCMTKAKSNRGRNPEKNNGEPKRQTLDFLRQFARVYKVEPMLREDICAFVLN